MAARKKAQMWIADLVISVIMFTAASLVAFTIILNSFSLGSNFDSVKKDAVRISEYILSEGTPIDWNETNLIRPGFLSDNRINETKVYRGMNLTNSSYGAVKSLLQTQNDFMVVFKNSTGQIIPFQDYCSFGDPWAALDYTANSTTLDCQAVNFTLEDYDNLIKLTRYTVYDSQLVAMEVYVWN